MKYLLDSDTIDAIFNKESPFFDKAAMKISQISESDEIFISILSLYELEFSLSNSIDDEVIEKIEGIKGNLENVVPILPLDSGGASIYGKLKSNFKKETGINRKSIKKHNIDIMIASTAVAFDCVLVARDKIYKDHLQKIESRLMVEDWTA